MIVRTVNVERNEFMTKARERRFQDALKSDPKGVKLFIERTSARIRGESYDWQ